MFTTFFFTLEKIFVAKKLNYREWKNIEIQW